MGALCRRRRRGALRAVTAAAANHHRRGGRGPLLLQICSGQAMGLRSVGSQPPLPPPQVPIVGRRCTGSWPPPRSARGVCGPPPPPWEPWVIFFLFFILFWNRDACGIVWIVSILWTILWMICGIYEYFISRFSILWLLLSNESFVLLVEDARGTGEDARERERTRWNGRGGLWYRLLFPTGTEEDFRHRLKTPVS